MKLDLDEEKRLIRAKQSVRRIKIFYINLAGYLVGISLLLYNLYIFSGPYKNNIISLNISILGAWTVFIIIHGINVFKGRKIFKKSWEDKKIDGFLNEKDKVETKFWE